MLRLFSILTVFLAVHVVALPPRPADYFPLRSAKHSRLFVSHYENILGTSLELKVSASSAVSSGKAEAAVLKEIARLSAILSGYDPHSEFSGWMKTAGSPERVSPELFEVLGLFDQWRIRTDGALDASAEVITKLWKQAAANGRLPSDAELVAAVNRVRQPHWKLDSVARTATHLSNAPLMLNSFAKSYIIRHAADAGLAIDGVDAIIVNIGGDLVISGNVNETVLVSDPKDDADNANPIDQLQVSNMAVATSGNYRRGELIAGHWYSHIVDPRTGQPAGHILSATVVASNATDAGALATAFNVLSPEESIRLASTIPGAQYLIITAAGNRIASSGWKDLEKGTTQVVPHSPGNFELLIDLEVNMQSAPNNYKRPYLAAWVEDEDHSSVRAISVWRGEMRYLRELKSWYLRYGDTYGSDAKFSSSITSATRPAGKYTLKWDGTDDQGKPVKPGKYVVKIEVAREHGTYQIMRQEIECDNQSKVVNLTGNVEISSASLDYRITTNGQ